MLLGIIARTALGLAAAAAPTPSAPRAGAQAIGPAPSVSAPAAASLGAAEIVDRVQQFYGSIQKVKARFRQSVTNNTFGTTKTSDGGVWIAKPGKMRWDYYEKDRDNKVKVKKSFISNGKYLYVVEHDNKQVLKKNLQQDLMPVAVSFLYGKGDLRAEFTPEIDASGTYGAAGDLVLKLTPKQPSAQYKNLFLVVSPTDFHVSQSIIIDSSSNMNHFQFYEPDFHPQVSDSIFEFDEASVKNYRVVDTDSSRAAGSTAPGEPPPPKAPAPLTGH